MGSKQVILSLDVSTTSTGYAIYVDGKLEQYGAIKSKSKNWIERVNYMANTLQAIHATYGITHIIIEDTYVSKNVNTVKKLCMAQGIIIRAVHTAKVIQVYPVSWKSYFNLVEGKNKRKVQKATSITKANSLFNLELKDDDVADALLLGYYVINKNEVLK